ncbi:MAG: type II secretion system protein [Armatimonadota bacterium]|nr:type II secretion system protein [Armatimonadota bacterium]
MPGVRQMPYYAHRSEGFSTLELVVAAAIIGIALVILIPRLSSRPLHFTADVQEFVDNLGVTRGLARSRTTHYQLRVISASQYVIEPGVLTGETWSFPTVERTLSLRPGVAFDAATVNRAAVFDSRGRLAGPEAEMTFVLVDTTRGWTKQIIVRTTGMVDAR